MAGPVAALSSPGTGQGPGLTPVPVPRSSHMAPHLPTFHPTPPGHPAGAALQEPCLFWTIHPKTPVPSHLHIDIFPYTNSTGIQGHCTTMQQPHHFHHLHLAPALLRHFQQQTWACSCWTAIHHSAYFSVLSAVVEYSLCLPYYPRAGRRTPGGGQEAGQACLPRQASRGRQAPVCRTLLSRPALMVEQGHMDRQPLLTRAGLDRQRQGGEAGTCACLCLTAVLLLCCMPH